jgi:hypothetical protein
MPINFFSFPNEIRNKIYEEALVLSELIIFVAAPYRIFKGLSLPRNTRECGPLRLCPAILLANKRVHREASPLLYSRNCFRHHIPTHPRPIFLLKISSTITPLHLCKG